MTFLAMILGLLLLQFWGADNPVQRDRWFYRLRERLAQYLQSPLWLTVVALLVPALLLHWALEIVRPLLFGLAWIAAAGLVLLYSFGRGDFHGMIDRYRAYCLERDAEAAWLYITGRLGGDAAAAAPDTAETFHSMARESLLYEGFQRWFPVLFYFLLAGPVGALVYRLAQLGAAESGDEADSVLVQVLDWLPSRLLALSFAVTGDFVRSRAALGEGLFSGEKASAVLGRVAGAAVPELGGDVSGPDAERAVAEMKDLLSRSAVLWVLVIALAELLF
ncbi:hypothetical protein [Parahaliea mediterranea]|uniref:Regulatory signaling modulator protein AmpE n=1 Tax=Parahaliea mediterranea TaxID=651086 RepID=A0A939IKX9_9GAMM|nr:hypothetical protein [Parahaliea mediterranea]MBN7795407.1 hypothetical protein [Parahaliea mediterranea]